MNIEMGQTGLSKSLATQSERLHSPDRHTLVLELGDADVDVLRFDAAIKKGSLPALEQAVGLYQGPLLEGCNEEWLPQERNVREQHCVQALQQLGEAALAAGNYAAAVNYYQRAASLDPWSDTARRGWMEALARNGDRNAALQVYRDFLNVLRSDPGAVADEQTRALYQRLRTEARQSMDTNAVATAKAVAAPIVTGYLPHPLTELVGREDERVEVAERLRRSRLVTLTGLGGIGKTRLAIEVASASVREYADGVWLVALEALADGKRVAQQIASVFGLREEPGRSLLQSVTEHLHKKRLLLVLDNCEHLLDASAQIVALLLRECAGVRILATSREALGITGETAWRVPSLAVPDPAHLPQTRATLLRVLMGYESVQLFVERAQAVQKTFALTDENALAMAQVCARLQGIPLALELAAARVKALTVAQIVARLDNELGLLTGGSRAAMSRQQTLRATLDWSYALLSEPERLLLHRLSVFAGGWNLEAARQVCEGRGIETEQIVDLLTGLVDKSLVSFEEREGGGRYRLLEIVRQYAAERLKASDEAEQVRASHRHWCLALAEEAAIQIGEANHETALQRFETEYDNLQASLQWEGGDPGNLEAGETGLRLATALWPFWHIRGYLSAGRTTLERMLTREGAQVSTLARARALQRAGSLASVQSDYAASQALQEESLSIQRRLGNKEGIASTLNSLGNDALEQGNYVLGQASYEEALLLFKELGDRGGAAWSLLNLGILATMQGDPILARIQIEESLSIRRELGHRYGVAFALYSLGVVVSSQNEPIAARDLYEESLSIRRELGDRPGIAYSLTGLGQAAHALNDYVSARSLYEESLIIFRELADPAGVATSLEGLAAVMTALAAPEKAACLWGAAAALQESIGAPLSPYERALRDHQIGQTRATLGEETFMVAWEQGRALTLEQAVAAALSEGEF